MNCKHEEFRADVRVNRLEDSGRFNADVKIQCIQCGTAFRFLGLPAGLDLNGASVSADGTEARLAIGTPETVANIIDGDCPVGFTVRRKSTWRDHQSRCPTCDEWYDDRNHESVKIHQHPEPQSGPARDAWLASRLPYEQWIRTTPEGKKWAADHF